MLFQIFGAVAEFPCLSRAPFDAQSSNSSVTLSESHFAFAAGDPYAEAGLFQSSAVMPWRKVFPEA